MTFGGLVVKNLLRNPLRLCLTLFATFIAFVVYGLLTALQVALDAGVELSAADRLIVVNKINFTRPLPLAYADRIRAVDGVLTLTHMNWFGGYFQDPQNQVATMAVDPESFLEVYNEILISPQERQRWLQNQQGLIAGESIAAANDWHVGDRIPLNSNIFSQRGGGTDWDFDVVAIYSGADRQTDTNTVYFHYKYFNETAGRNSIGRFGVRTADPAMNEDIVAAIDDMFSNTPHETQTVPEKTFNKAFLEQIGDLALIIRSVVLAAFFIILMVVGNSMVMTVRERTNEIGILKSLGFTSGRVFSLVLLESLLVATVGGVAGIGSARLLVGVINGMSYPVPTLILGAGIALKALLIMIALGVITGLLPAVSAFRLRTSAALGRS